MNTRVNNQENINKWRLILGKNSKNYLFFAGGQEQQLVFEDMEEALDYLYSREQGDDVRSGSLGPSSLNAVTWLNRVRKLFPKETAEVLEKHALEHFHMKELIADKEVMERLEPNLDLLKVILQFKHLIKGEILDAARRIVAKVAGELTEKLETEIRMSFLGRIDKNAGSNVKSIRNLDIKKTLRYNLRNYDREQQRLVIKKLYFNSRVKNRSPWRVIIAVDESGSMLGSVIHSAIMAGIFARLPMVDIRLIIFDTQVVDLSGYEEDPVEVLMRLQLGGGTNIAGALGYCLNLLELPHKTLVITVTDLFEGQGTAPLLRVSKSILESGAKLAFLTALDEEANPDYNRGLGQQLADLGAFVGAMTPQQLGDYIGIIMK